MTSQPKVRVARRRRRTLFWGILLFGVLVTLSILATLLAPFDPIEQSTGAALAEPSWVHPFGTDELGRDVLSRVLHGGRTVLVVAIGSVTLAAVCGSALGLLAGFHRGALDIVLSRIAEIQLSLPLVLFTVMVVVVLGPGVPALVVGIGVSQIPVFFRLARSLALVLREATFVQSSRTLGADARHILRWHIAPNTAPVIGVQVSTTIGLAILASTGLNYLGFGVQPPTPDWGALVSEYQPFVFTRWWLPLIPGFGIAVTVLSLNLLSDGLNARYGISTSSSFNL